MMVSQTKTIRGLWGEFLVQSRSIANLKWKFFAAVLAALTAFCLQPVRAFAVELRIRNDFDKKMDVAVVYFDGQAQKWRTRGWYSVEPRGDRKLNFSSTKSDIYVHAHISSFSMTWGNGDITKTVISKAFSYYDGQTCPPGNNRRSVKFTKYTAKNNIVDYRPSGQAPLELRIRNDFDKKMSVAVIYFDSQSRKLRTRGWYSAEPYSERKLSFRTSISDIYLHASLSGSTMTWGKGDATKTVITEAFSYLDDETCPPGNNRRNVKFTKYNAKNNVVDYRPSWQTPTREKSLGESLKELEQSFRELRDLFK
jgi:uncharacterized membrane protein